MQLPDRFGQWRVVGRCRDQIMERCIDLHEALALSLIGVAGRLLEQGVQLLERRLIDAPRCECRDRGLHRAACFDDLGDGSTRVVADDEALARTDLDPAFTRESMHCLVHGCASALQCLAQFGLGKELPGT